MPFEAFQETCPKQNQPISHLPTNKIHSIRKKSQKLKKQFRMDFGKNLAQSTRNLSLISDKIP